MSLTEAQLALRRTGLSATDMVTLAGFNDFGSPLDVYAEKLGAPPKAATLAMRMGHAAEPVVMDLLAERYGLHLAPGDTVRHWALDWVLATPDRFVLPANDHHPKRRPEAVCEGKLVGWRQVVKWQDEDGERSLANNVVVQGTWQMGTTCTSRCYVGALLGGWGDSDFHHAIIEFHQNMWSGLLEIGERFWKDHVLARVPPTPDDTARAAESLERLFPAVRRSVLERVAGLDADLMTAYLDASAEAKRIEARKSELANLLRARIGEAEGIVSTEAQATWKEQKGRVDVGKLAAHFRLSDEQLDPFRGDSSRVLRVRLLNQKERGFYGVHNAA